MSLPSEKQQCIYWDKWLLAFGLKAKETAGRCGECEAGGGPFSRANSQLIIARKNVDLAESNPPMFEGK